VIPMSQRIRVGQGTQNRFVADLGRKLKSIIISYRHDFYSKEVAKERGKGVIEDEFDALLRLSRDRVRWRLKRPVELPPEERRRLERWRDDYIKDFNGIIDDVK